MPAEKIVYYADGSKATVRTLMIDQIMVERDAFARNIEDHAVEAACRAIHHALTRTGQVFASYDDWIGDVEDVDIDSVTEGTVKPDPPERPSDTAQQSP